MWGFVFTIRACWTKVFTQSSWGWLQYIYLFMSIGFVFIVLYLLVLIRLYPWFLLEHLVLILLKAHFLKFWDGLGRAENCKIVPLFHGIIMCCLLSSLNACILCLNEGKGIILLLHGVKIVNSTV